MKFFDVVLTPFLHAFFVLLSIHFFYLALNAHDFIGVVTGLAGYLFYGSMVWLLSHDLAERVRRGPLISKEDGAWLKTMDRYYAYYDSERDE